MAVLIRKFVFFWVQVQQRLLVLCNALCTIIEREGMQPSRIAYLVHNTDKSLFIGCPDNLFRKFIEFPHYSSCGTSHHSTTSIQSATQSLPCLSLSPVLLQVSVSMCRIYIFITPTSQSHLWPVLSSSSFTVFSSAAAVTAAQDVLLLPISTIKRRTMDRFYGPSGNSSPKMIRHCSDK